MPRKNLFICFEVWSDFGYLPFLTGLFRALKTPRPYDLTQIMVETYNNAVIHAHRLQRKKWIGIEILLTPKWGRIRVRDEGGGIPAKFFKKISGRWQTSGRGLALIQAKADRVSSRRRGRHHIFEMICLYE